MKKLMSVIALVLLIALVEGGSADFLIERGPSASSSFMIELPEGGGGASSCAVEAMDGGGGAGSFVIESQEGSSGSWVIELPEGSSGFAAVYSQYACLFH